MFQSPDSRKNISLVLSEVLDDIGVNERMVNRARETYHLMESMNSIIVGNNIISFALGSQSEGTTTCGLNSDRDLLICLFDYNIIHDWSEWEQGKLNYFMIEDENTTPGYCFLQLLKHDEPLPATNVPDDHHITDRRGRILLKSTVYPNLDTFENGTLQGPSLSTKGSQGFTDKDNVIALPCKSWPKSASDWLKSHNIGRWPTQEIFGDFPPCFVVPVGSKISVKPELEWRISTSLTERCLMRDLNITQIRCYVLMKMVLKSFLNPQGKINISSFMCKTVIFHCIEYSEPSTWTENNLLKCLKDCLRKLHSCAQNEHLSHFIIQENNLMAGQLTAETKHQLLKNISDFIQNDVQSILRIDIDNLGQRLDVKLNLQILKSTLILLNCVQYIFSINIDNLEQSLKDKLRSENNSNSSLKRCEGFSAAYYYLIFSKHSSENHNFLIRELQNKDLRKMKQTVEMIMTNNKALIEIDFPACMLLGPLLCTTYGTSLASASIGLKQQVSPQALVWLLDGLDSDVSSGRLKMASVFYSAGDMETTEKILRHTGSQYYYYPVVPICGCNDSMPPPEITAEVKKVCSEQNEYFVKNIAAFCVRFLKQEINCVPHELQYEMFRSTQDEKMKHRDQDFDHWMDWAVSDSLPYLYFLQYKVYRHLQRYQDKQQALWKLAKTIETDESLRHKETALNLLGQCMEQENRPKQAIKYYLLSLQQRARNNVARIHICRLLFGVLVDMECIL